MSTRFTLLMASAAMIATATSAAAHEHGPHGPHQTREVVIETDEGVYDGEWEGHWQDGDTWRGMWNGTYTAPDGQQLHGQYVGTFIGQGRFVTDDGRVLLLDERRGWRETEGEHHVRIIRRQRGPLGASPDGRLGYTMAEREQWLAECRLLMADAGGYRDHDDRDADGALIGGILGAVAGGVAGNRIADGDRLAGTLIGAGVGGLAGAAIGSLLDGDGDGEVDANELWAARYCDAYLRRYEMGGGAGYHGHGHGHAQPVMMVQAVAAAPHGYPGHRHGPHCNVRIREEWIDMDAHHPAPTARRAIPPHRPHPAPAPAAAPAPAPQPEPQGKVTPIG
ncbi:glycine zipper 2TM domain-containing protein [Aurantiacibacter sp. MUD11]|uniref:YMGG-like glycine zipper-containing protein n=1 Tax=Aurantiacibacter sp. MUD11 TaxID=3003265 RepID=UPI0022AAA0B5|nr:YMGG-like glycine zipper-containing protein [Aurantiacibacter sp. MUD11]WAT17203.1 glycine zipper 2TM domain-containing protein [Aurantiacibacter sp. MUD11]